MRIMGGLIVLLLFWGSASLSAANELVPIEAKQFEVISTSGSEQTPKVESLKLTMESGRVIFCQYLLSNTGINNKPTLLLLPGVNRSIFLNEPGAQYLAKLGYNLVTFHFSLQPLSVAQIENGVEPYFSSRELNLSDLAEEATFVSQKLAKQFKLKSIVPVSLSYSGAISPFLTDFAVVIESVPMTSSAAVNPQLESYRQTLKAGELWNPIYGPGITRGLLDAAYRQTWSKQVDGLIQQYSLPKQRREDMIEGYLQMSRATEGFTWQDKSLQENLATGPARLFVVAAKDSPTLLKHQLETFLEFSKLRDDSILALVMDSGHILPSDKPFEYAQIIDWLLSSKRPIDSGVVIVSPSQVEGEQAEIQYVTGEGAQIFIKDLIKQL